MDNESDSKYQEHKSYEEYKKSVCQGVNRLISKGHLFQVMKNPSAGNKYDVQFLVVLSCHKEKLYNDYGFGKFWEEQNAELFCRAMNEKYYGPNYGREQS